MGARVRARKRVKRVKKGRRHKLGRGCGETGEEETGGNVLERMREGGLGKMDWAV